MANVGESLLVIFGAGASWDCVPGAFRINLAVRGSTSETEPERLCNQVRPPLTSRLVESQRFANEYALRYSDSAPVIVELRGQQEREAETPFVLEEALRDYQKRAAFDPSINRQLLAFRFYLRDRLRACGDYMVSADLGGLDTNYARLAGAVWKWATGGRHMVTFVSFNYDTLLDRACAPLWGLREEDLRTYTSNRTGRLLKPHGSVSWIWSDPRWPRARPLGGRAVLDFIAENETEEIRVPSCLQWADGPAIGGPAMALPIVDKSDLVWPEDQRARFDQLDHVTRVITVGWRAAENDFCGLLRPHLEFARKSLVVTTGSPDDLQEWDQICTRIGLRDARGSHVRGFSGLLDPLERELATVLE